MRRFCRKALVLAGVLVVWAQGAWGQQTILTLWFVGTNAWSTSSTQYVNWGSQSLSTTQTSADTWSPGTQMVVYGMACAVSTTPATGNRIFTLMLNAAAVGASCTITTAEPTCAAMNTPPVVIVAGDLITMRSTRTTTSAMGGGCLFRVSYAPVR